MQLINGECLSEMAKLGTGTVDLILTDPPYGTTACKWDSVIPLEPMWEQLNRIIKPNGAIVMTASQPFTTTLISSNLKMFKYCWVWEKSRGSNFAHTKFQPLKTHEDVVVFSCGGSASNSKTPMTYNPQFVYGGEPYVRKGSGTTESLAGGMTKSATIVNINTTGKRHPRTVQKFKSDREKFGRFHPTQKPVALMEYLIKTYTNEGETVLDFTMGSGTTGVACKNLNRDFLGIELDKKYFDIATKRINNTII